MTYTREMFRRFDKLTMRLSSRNQMERISARLDIAKFEKEHGKEVCREMYEEIKRYDAAGMPTSTEGK